MHSPNGEGSDFIAIHTILIPTSIISVDAGEECWPFWKLTCKGSYQIFVYIRRKKTLTEDEIWEMEDKLAALNKELEESLRNTSCWKACSKDVSLSVCLFKCNVWYRLSWSLLLCLKRIVFSIVRHLAYGHHWTKREVKPLRRELRIPESYTVLWRRLLRVGPWCFIRDFTISRSFHSEIEVFSFFDVPEVHIRTQDPPWLVYFFVRRSGVSSWKGALRALHLSFSHFLFPIDFLFRLRFLELALPCSFRCALHFLFRQSPRPLFMVLGCSVNGHQRIFNILVKIYCGWFVLLRPSDWAHVILGAMHAM